MKIRNDPIEYISTQLGLSSTVGEERDSLRRIIHLQPQRSMPRLFFLLEISTLISKGLLRNTSRYIHSVPPHIRVY